MSPHGKTLQNDACYDKNVTNSTLLSYPENITPVDVSGQQH
jgi:hypothetical protein